MNLLKWTSRYFLRLFRRLLQRSHFSRIFRDIFLLKTKPHAYTWLIWSINARNGGIRHLARRGRLGRAESRCWHAPHRRRLLFFFAIRDKKHHQVRHDYFGGGAFGDFSLVAASRAVARHLYGFGHRYTWIHPELSKILP